MYNTYSSVLKKFLFFIIEVLSIILIQLNMLTLFKKLIEVEQKSKKDFQLNPEAQSIAESGSYEANIFAKIPDEGILQAELMKLPNAKLGNLGFSKIFYNL